MLSKFIYGILPSTLIFKKGDTSFKAPFDRKNIAFATETTIMTLMKGGSGKNATSCLNINVLENSNTIWRQQNAILGDPNSCASPQDHLIE